MHLDLQALYRDRLPPWHGGAWGVIRRARTISSIDAASVAATADAGGVAGAPAPFVGQGIGQVRHAAVVYTCSLVAAGVAVAGAGVLALLQDRGLEQIAIAHGLSVALGSTCLFTIFDAVWSRRLTQVPNEQWTSTIHVATKAVALRVAVVEAIVFGCCGWMKLALTGRGENAGWKCGEKWKRTAELVLYDGQFGPIYKHQASKLAHAYICIWALIGIHFVM